MVKKVNKKKILLTSFVLAVLVFIAGLFLGLALDDFRVNDAIASIQLNELDTESYYVEQDFLNSFGEDKCESVRPRMEVLSTQLGEIGELLNRYEARNMFKGDDFDYLKKKYFILEVKLYNILYGLNGECGLDTTVIMFFYDKDHAVSTQQGYVLDRLVKTKEEIYVFSFDREVEDNPLVDTIKLHHNITESPTLIINFETKKEGFVGYDELVELIAL